MNAKKLDCHLMRALERHSPRERLPVIVRYRRDRAAPKGLLPGMEVRRQFSLIPAFSASLAAHEVDALSEDPRVDRLWYDLPVKVLLDLSVPAIGAPLIWAEGYDGAGVKVGVIDTGIDPRHPDLQGRIGGMADVTGEGVTDLSGHGTHVAGIIAGTGGAQGGRYRGVAPGAQLFIAKALRSDGSGAMSDSIAGLEWAVGQRSTL